MCWSRPSDVPCLSKTDADVKSWEYGINQLWDPTEGAWFVDPNRDRARGQNCGCAGTEDEIGVHQQTETAVVAGLWLQSRLPNISQ